MDSLAPSGYAVRPSGTPSGGAFGELDALKCFKVPEGRTA